MYAPRGSKIFQNEMYKILEKKNWEGNAKDPFIRMKLENSVQLDVPK